MGNFLRFFISLIIIFIARPVYAEFCDGKYSKAKALVDKAYTKYGTLYSGGRGYEGIGETLGIYRLLSGLPDAGFSAREKSDGNREYLDAHIEVPFDSGNQEERKIYFEQVREVLGRNLSRLQDPEFTRNTDKTKSDIEIIFDHYATMGPYLGWWIGPASMQLSDLERIIGSFRDDDGMDWIHTVLAVSANGVKANWGSRYQYYTIEGRGYQNLFNHSIRRFATKDSLPWFVAAHLTMDQYEGGRYKGNKPKDVDVETLFKTYLSLMYAVKTCTATEAEYVAFSIALFERTRLGMFLPWIDGDSVFVGEYIPIVEPKQPENYEKITGYPLKFLTEELMVLPDVLRNMAAVSITQKMANLPPWGKQYEVSAENLRKLATTSPFRSWSNVFRSYSAKSVEELIKLNEGVRLNPKTLRMLNLLSVDDLVKFSNSRTGFRSEQRMIYTAAFLRMFALGRDEEALAMVPTLGEFWYDFNGRISSFLVDKETAGYRLAKIAKLLPTKTTLIVPLKDENRNFNKFGDFFKDHLQSDPELLEWYTFRRSWDMPVNIRTGAFLERDAKKWLRANGASSWAGEAYDHRASKRGITTRLGYPKTHYRRYRDIEYFRKIKQGIMSYAAFEEHKKISPARGLANRIARELILHARQNSIPLRNGFSPADEDVANELRYVVKLGKLTTSGEMDEKPVSLVAYNLLKRHFVETEAAKKTRYWYVCKERCAR